MRFRLMDPYGPARQSALCESGTKKQKPRGIAAAGSFVEARYIASLRGRLLPATAATTTATATRAAGTTATAAAATTTLTFLRFIHAQGTTAHVFPVEGLNGALSVSTRHFHEAEAARTTGFAVVDQGDGFHGAVLFEHLPNLILVGRERQVTHIDLCHSNTVSLKKPRARPPCKGLIITAR